MKRNDRSLRRLAEAHTKHLTEVLNQTVAEKVHVGCVRPDGSDDTMIYGTGLWPGQSRSSYVPLRSASDHPVWLRIAGRLFLDPAGFLTVRASSFALAAGDPPAELLHYDYERDKVAYPDAHIQVEAASGAWAGLLASSGRSAAGLGKIHLPVGGRRYRPAIEDLMETLILEDLVEPHPGWEKVIDAGRDDFRRRQLRAAIRNDPDTAAAALRLLRYDVDEPDRSGSAAVAMTVRAAKTKLFRDRKAKRRR